MLSMYVCRYKKKFDATLFLEWWIFDQETRKLKPRLSSFLPLYRCIGMQICKYATVLDPYALWTSSRTTLRCLPLTCTCFMEIISTPYINAVSTILDTCTSSLYTTANALMQRSFYGAEQKSARQGQELLPFSKLKKKIELFHKTSQVFPSFF